MKVVIAINLKGSALTDSPEDLKGMVQKKIDEMIADDPIIGLFVVGYSVEMQTEPEKKDSE